MCVSVRERVCVCVRDRECVCGVCVWWCVCERECVRERMSGVCERER